MAITQWYTTAEVELNQTFNDWRETTNKIRFNLAEINPASSTINADVASFVDVDITGNTVISGSYTQNTPGSFFTIQNANTTINSATTRIGRDNTDVLEVRASSQFEGDAEFTSNLTMGDATSTGTITSAYFSGQGQSVTNIQWSNIDGKPDFGSIYATAPINYSELDSELKSALIPGNSLLLFRNTGTPPTGFTEVTGYTDYALRVNQGSVSQGGTENFTTAFSNRQFTPSGTVSLDSLSLVSTKVASTLSVNISNTLGTGNKSLSGSTGATTLTDSQIPNHWHHIGSNVSSTTAAGPNNYMAVTYDVRDTDNDYILKGTATEPTVLRSGGVSGGSGGGSHTHTYAGSSHNHSITGSISGTITNVGSGHTHNYNSGSAGLTFTGSQTSINMTVKYVDFRIVKRTATTNTTKWAS